MFGISQLDRRSKPERVADQAWEYLTSTVNSTGDTLRHTARDTARAARRTTSHLTDDATGRAGAVAGEARDRAVRAYDALAGHRPGLPWGWLVGIGLVGAAIGWAAGMAAARARQHAEEFGGDTGAAGDTGTGGTGTGDLEFVDVDRPSATVSRES